MEQKMSRMLRREEGKRGGGSKARIGRKSKERGEEREEERRSRKKGRGKEKKKEEGDKRKGDKREEGRREEGKREETNINNIRETFRARINERSISFSILSVWISTNRQ